MRLLGVLTPDPPPPAHLLHGAKLKDDADKHRTLRTSSGEQHNGITPDNTNATKFNLKLPCTTLRIHLHVGRQRRRKGRRSKPGLQAQLSTGALRGEEEKRKNKTNISKKKSGCTS
jgi:hypothetical protein